MRWLLLLTNCLLVGCAARGNYRAQQDPSKPVILGGEDYALIETPVRRIYVPRNLASTASEKIDLYQSRGVVNGMEILVAPIQKARLKSVKSRAGYGQSLLIY